MKETFNGAILLGFNPRCIIEIISHAVAHKKRTKFSTQNKKCVAKVVGNLFVWPPWLNRFNLSIESFILMSNHQ